MGQDLHFPKAGHSCCLGSRESVCCRPLAPGFRENQEHTAYSFGLAGLLRLLVFRESVGIRSRKFALGWTHLLMQGLV